MPRNVYFSQGTTPEKRLYEDITIEALKIYGHDVYYIPRTIVNTNAIFNEDALSKFGEAFQIEMYVENTDGFEGDGDLLSKFGVEVRDSMTLVLSNRRWEELVGRFQPTPETRPQEGDLIYFPLVNGLFQITFVEDESPFYQIANIPTFKLTCELFEYGNEAIDTGIEEIDRFETKFATRTQLTLGSGSGIFQVGEDVTQVNATSGITVTGEVATTPIAENRNWLQLGQDIDGEAEFDQSGRRVSMNDAGNRVAIGAIGNDGNGTSSGHTRIYKYSNGTWSQLGQDIDGEAVGDNSGYSVSMNSTGDRVAIGAIYNDGNGTSSGHTRIYEYSNGTWSQLGQDIDGEVLNDQSGYSVSMNDAGNRVAIGAIGNDGNGSNSGHTRIYEYDGTNWTQLGQDIDGEAVGDISGYSVSMNSTGDRVAIGAIYNDGNGTSSGHTRIYEYDDITQEWVQLGNDIDGEGVNDFSGRSVSLNANGDRVAIGALGNPQEEFSGYTIIYEFNGTNWTQLGSHIDGESYSISINAAGDRVTIGDRTGVDDSGRTRIYEFNVSTQDWVQLSDDIYGEAAGDISGFSVSMNAEGNRVAIGARYNDGVNGTASGHTRIYEYAISGYNSGATIEISSQEASDGSNTLFAPTSGTTPGNIVGSTSGASYAITSTNAFSALDSNDPFADNEDFENAISAGDFIDFSETNPFGEVNITT